MVINLDYTPDEHTVYSKSIVQRVLASAHTYS